MLLTEQQEPCGPRLRVLSAVVLLSARLAALAQPIPDSKPEDFFQAMLAGETQVALQLLSANTNMARSPIHGGRYPLLVAASRGQLEVVDSLLKLGVDLNAEGDTWDTSNHRLTALEVAIWYNHPPVVKRLLEAGANPNHLNPLDGTPLHFAFTYKHSEMAGWLLDHGADPFLRNPFPYRRQTAFELGITLSDGKLVPRMLQAGRVSPVGLNRTGKAVPASMKPELNQQAAQCLMTDGVALLTAAAQRGEAEAVAALLEAGVSAKEPAGQGFSLLQTFALSEAEAAKAKDFRVERWSQIRTLLEQHGAQCDALAATGLGDLDTARRLCATDKKAAEVRDCEGATPLHWAVRTDRPSLTSFWLAAGASPAATNFSGQTALHLAATRGLTDQVTRLLAAQAPTNARDTNGWTPLEAAIKAKQTETIRILLKANAPGTTADRGVTTPLHEAAASANVAAMAALLNATNIEARNELGLTPWHIAAKAGQLGAAALLFDKGANVNARDPDGNTALHVILLSRTHWVNGRPSAAWLERMKQAPHQEKFWRAYNTPSGHTSPHEVAASVAFFMACGVDSAATNRAGQTVLQIVMAEATMLWDYDRAAILPLLQQSGSGLDERDANGDTALHRAARDIWTEKVTELITAGADVNATNHLGRTPLHAAVEKLGTCGDFTPLTELLRAKPNVNAQDNEGMTALFVLEMSDSSFKREATRALLDAGADPNLRDKRGRAPTR